MNGAEEVARCNSPRLPAEGKEIDTSYDFINTEDLQKRSPWLMASPVKDRVATPTRHCFNEDTVSITQCSIEEQVQNDNTSSQNLELPTENGPIAGPPPYYQWAENIQGLLNDPQGTELYNQFLLQDGLSNNSLNFWLACSRLKSFDPPCNLEGTISALYRSFLRRSKEVSHETKDEIKKKIQSKTALDVSVFDKAQKEIEDHMRTTTYPNFLRSDVYIQYLRNYQDKNERTEFELESSSLDPPKVLATVHEDAELQITASNKRLSKSMCPKNRTSEPYRSKPEASLNRFVKNPTGNYGSYHLKYSSFLPTSAQDSELQSLSSDAQTDDTMSQTGSSVDFGPSRYSKSNQRKHHKSTRHNIILNKDGLAFCNFIPRTQRSMPESLTPEKFHSFLVKKLNDYLDDVKLKEKINEKIQSIEGYESSPKPPENLPVQKPLKKPLFEPNFISMLGYVEENVQDILDRHISRVWQDSSHQTPVLSPGYASPSNRTSSELADFSAAPCRPATADAMSDTALHNPKCNLTSRPNTQLGNPTMDSLRYRKDLDARSFDSGAISEEALSSIYKSIAPYAPAMPAEHQRHHRDQLRRSQSKDIAADSCSSCVDSGVSMVYNPTSAVHEKVSHWFNSSNSWFNVPASDVRKDGKRPTLSNMPEGLVASRSTSQSHNIDYIAPALPVDTTAQLLEARRRLVDEKLIKVAKSKKQNRKSAPTMQDNPPTINEMTTIGYCYGNHSVPFLSKFPGKNITLKQFKSLLSKKGNFRYFFKKASNDFGTGVVMEEISEDNEILPLWEGKVFSVIESMD